MKTNYTICQKPSYISFICPVCGATNTVDHVTATFECLSENRLDYLDIQKVIKDETGFEIEIPNRRFI